MNINEDGRRPHGWHGRDGDRCISVIPRQVCGTGWERLIRSHSSARFSFELSGNSN